jgi:hypothetical protein
MFPFSWAATLPGHGLDCQRRAIHPAGAEGLRPLLPSIRQALWGPGDSRPGPVKGGACAIAEQSRGVKRPVVMSREIA